MDTDLHVVGPIRDSETDIRVYTIRQGDREVEFSVMPVETGDGITGWTMRFGPDSVVPGNFSTEPYETQEEAFEAGMRAARQVFEAS
jgi:hypothetical protein